LAQSVPHNVQRMTQDVYFLVLADEWQTKRDFRCIQHKIFAFVCIGIAVIRRHFNYLQINGTYAGRSQSPRCAYAALFAAESAKIKRK